MSDAGTTPARLGYAFAECSLGRVLVADGAAGVWAILAGDSDDGLVQELAAMAPRAERVADSSLEALAAAAAAGIGGRESPLELDLTGTPFQQKVWTALQQIPCGQTVTYAQLTERLGHPPTAIRAVAGAVARNRHAVWIPCHRVVGANGELTGYRWGLHRKRALLARESGQLELAV